MHEGKYKMSGGHACFFIFFNFRASKDFEISRLSNLLSYICKGLSERNTYIPHMILFYEN